MRMPIHLLVLQLLPILVFLVVDALVQDPVWAIASALVFVALQTVLIYLRTKKLDAFIAIDALLIGSLGAVSLLTENQWFFMLKPAIIEGIMVPYLLFLAFARDRTLQAYFKRYSIGMTIRPEAFSLMRKLLIWMAAWVVVHAGLTVMAVFLWSRQVWGWISGPGFYLLLVPMAAWVVYRRIKFRRQDRA